jgi:aryl sulfotransferase
MQMIVLNLLHGGREGASLGDTSPWVDMRLTPLDEVMSRLEAQRSRRFVKTHLPLDGLPYFPTVKYIVVGRDARDVFMSLWNHYRNYNPDFYERINDSASLVGAALPYCPSDVRQLWRWWITRGLFEWESEGYPFWANMRHVQSWWNYRHLPNILFVHFNDLLSDLEGEILRVAGFLDIETPEDTLPSIVDAVTFKTMKTNAERILPNFGDAFRGGAQTFIYKDTNGRWIEVLTAGDLELYEAAADRELSSECALWLEHGRSAVPDAREGIRGK